MPASVAVPETFAIEAVGRRQLHQIGGVRPENCRLPETVIAPGPIGGPGANTPPLTLVVGRMPLPPSVRARVDRDAARRRQIAVDQERAGLDGPGLIAGSGQRPGRGVDLVEGGEALILRPDLREIEAAGAGAAELERVGAAGQRHCR